MKRTSGALNVDWQFRSDGMIESESWSLYLDFDGVLNSEPFLRRQRNALPRAQHKLFDQRNVVALDLLCQRLPVGAIIVTSTWREGRSVQQLRELLSGEGLVHAGLVVDVTGVGKSRAAEILAHVETNRVSRYIVLDDLNLHPLEKPVFFQTSGAFGLTGDQVEKILSYVG